MRVRVPLPPGLSFSILDLDFIAMTDRSDAELVAAVLAGEREAFSELVRRYQDYAYGAAIGLLSDFDLARDVVQEAFLAAYRDLARLRDPERFGGWLRGIVRNTAYRALRELKRVRKIAEGFAGTAETFARTPSPDEGAEHAEQREIVQLALDRLKSKNREAVSLYYVNGFSYEDIAGFLGVTEAAVQGRLQRGRAELRKELKVVKETFERNELPEDFSEEVRRLLEISKDRGPEHERAIRQLAGMGEPAVQLLLGALEDGRIPVRRAAARALCRIGDPRALRPLLRLLYADDWAGMDTFSTSEPLNVPGMREALLAILSDRIDSQWTPALTVLSRLHNDDEVRRVVLESFQRTLDEGQSQPWNLLWAACRLAPESAGDLVGRTLLHGDSRARRYAYWLAGAYGWLPSLEDGLRAWRRHRAWPDRESIGRMILRHGDVGRAALRGLMDSGEPEDAKPAAVVLARFRDAGAFEKLKPEVLGNPQDSGWARFVLKRLAAAYGRDFVDWVSKHREEIFDQAALAWALAGGRTEGAQALVEDLNRTGTPNSRMAAVRYLAHTQGAGALPELQRCLRAGKPRKVAQEAFRQILHLGEASTEVALAMLDSDCWTERKAAVCLLRRWGKLTPEQQARAEKDPHTAVRHAARWRHADAHHPVWGNRPPKGGA